MGVLERRSGVQVDVFDVPIFFSYSIRSSGIVPFSSINFTRFVPSSAQFSTEVKDKILLPCFEENFSSFHQFRRDPLRRGVIIGNHDKNNKMDVDEVLSPYDYNPYATNCFETKKSPFVIYRVAQYHTAQILFDTQPFLALLARLCEGHPQPGHYIFQTLGWFLWRLLARFLFTHQSGDRDCGFVQNIV